MVCGMTKGERYGRLLEKAKALVEGKLPPAGALANLAALVQEEMGFFWTGFYVICDGKLLLGPFQGPVACYEIPFGKGVCGTAWKKGETVVVRDVEEFPGHIACSSLSRSEIVVPVKDEEGSVVGVLDIDSKEIGMFDDEDRQGLEPIAALAVRFLRDL